MPFHDLPATLESGRAEGRSCVRLAVLVHAFIGLAWMLFGTAAAISYTVQVVALSDQDAALELQRDLINEGYPVYLVSVQTEAGAVYRLRVGSFTNRAAALNFARAMGTVEGSMPAPALAEGIPEGLIPVEPELIVSYPYQPGSSTLAFVDWDGEVAIRYQQLTDAGPLEAEYRVLTPELARRPFSAWWAGPDPQADGAHTVVRLRSFALWPGDFEQLSEQELVRVESERLLALSASFDMGPEKLKSYRFRLPETGLPFVVLAERLSLMTGEQPRLPALGNPANGLEATGPALTWFSERQDYLFADMRGDVGYELVVALEQDPATVEPAETEASGITGGGWTATQDGSYTRLRLESANRSWRAVAGTPLWAHGQFLLVIDQDELKLYQLLER